MSRRTVSTASLLVSAALLAGCGTGLEAQTYRESGRQDGASVDLGSTKDVAVRHLHVQGPASGSGFAVGDTAIVTGALVSTGTTADALIGASSDVAASATLTVDGTPTTEVAIPAGGSAPGTWAVLLTGLRQPVKAATYVPVTLEFQRAGRVTLRVPVDAGDNGLSGRTPEQDPYAEG